MPESGANYSGTLYQQLAGEDFSVCVSHRQSKMCQIYSEPRAYNLF